MILIEIGMEVSFGFWKHLESVEGWIIGVVEGSTIIIQIGS